MLTPSLNLVITRPQYPRSTPLPLLHALPHHQAVQVIGARIKQSLYSVLVSTVYLGKTFICLYFPLRLSALESDIWTPLQLYFFNLLCALFVT